MQREARPPLTSHFEFATSAGRSQVTGAGRQGIGVYFYYGAIEGQKMRKKMTKKSKYRCPEMDLKLYSYKIVSGGKKCHKFH
jgi:hypothetical protein